MRAVRAARPSPHQHEFEAAPGLPEALPAGERILWQGSPDAGRMALRVFHLRKVAVYFAVLIGLQAWHLAESLPDPVQRLRALVPAFALALLGLGLLGLWSWMCARTTLYTLTDRRVVLRIGIVLTLTFNLPLRELAGASLRADPQGCGDLPLSLVPQARIAWVHLWPHARPWTYARAEPTLRCIPDAARVAGLLTQAWQAAQAGTPLAAPQPPAPRSAGPRTSASRPDPAPRMAGQAT